MPTDHISHLARETKHSNNSVEMMR